MVKDDQTLLMSGLPIHKCVQCGIIHQVVDMTGEELGRWYREEYHRDWYRHTYEQDLQAGRLRVKAYGAKLRGRVLDIGSGNGAFVNACLEQDLDAVGQEVSDYAGNGHIYTGDLNGVHFPVERFDTVTCHDVLEHVPDMRAMLKEAQRVLSPGGWFLCEFPDFNFDRHWKRTEHLWCLLPEQVERLLREYFHLRYFTRPVEGKVTFYCQKRPQKRATMLVPPGLGDSYWSLVKMPGFMKAHGLGEVIDIWVSDGDDRRRRSEDWIASIPWAKSCGYKRHKLSSPVFREAYMQRGRYLFKGVCGCEWFMAFNGRMRYGEDIDRIEPGWGSDWYPPMFESLHERKMVDTYRQRFGGPYVVAYFVPHGMYSGWLKQFKAPQIVEQLKVVKAAGYQVVFMGAGWDTNGLPHELARQCKGIDYTGKTSFEEMLALIKGSEGVIGWPAGNTILATVLRKQTLMFWNRYFKQGFWGFSCPPDSRGDWYHWIETNQDHGAAVKGWLERMGA
jgi:2-polyprenyl-3-methyl-5-hydroxy-6-metoxy-1,4-benzoquinol methylase